MGSGVVCTFPICWGWGRDGCLFVFKFSFIEDQVCEIFDGVLVDISHEDFNDWFWHL